MDESKSIVVAQDSQSTSMLAMIMRAANDPTVDAAKVTTLADLAIKLRKEEKEERFNIDLNAALSEMPIITKGGVITIPAKDGRPERIQGRFARFEDIDRVIRPILQKHNLAIRFEVGEANGTVSVRPIISHANGHTERGDAMKLPLDTSGSKNNTQGAGSAVTYGKRYTLCAALNIVTEGVDDDGNMSNIIIGMPEERSRTVLDEAESAAAHGNYKEWFRSQSPKDRGWLVKSGHHEAFGGSASAIENKVAPANKRASIDADNAALMPDNNLSEANPAGWAAAYIKQCDEVESIDALLAVQKKGQPAIAKLEKGGFTTLHRLVIEAGTRAYARLSGEPVKDAGLFGGDV